MKHVLKAMTVLAMLLLFASMPGAQTTNGEKKTRDLFVKTLYINKVYSYAEGYRVEYLTSKGLVYTCYIPLDWFGKASAKAELVSVENSSVPYMDVIYDNGAFSYIRLVLSPDVNAPSWGSPRPGEDVSTKFKVDTLSLVF